MRTCSQDKAQRCLDHAVYLASVSNGNANGVTKIDEVENEAPLAQARLAPTRRLTSNFDPLDAYQTAASPGPSMID